MIERDFFKSCTFKLRDLCERVEIIKTEAAEGNMYRLLASKVGQAGSFISHNASFHWTLQEC